VTRSPHAFDSGVLPFRFLAVRSGQKGNYKRFAGQMKNNLTMYILYLAATMQNQVCNTFAFLS
jgi:hypothetical protein